MAETDAQPFNNSYKYGTQENTTKSKKLDEFGFRKILLNLDQNLTQHDLIGLKYLCLDKFIGLRHGELEKVERGLEILDKLEKRGLLSKDKLEVIIELLVLIDRIDLKIKVEEHLSFSQRQEQWQNISPYRRMILDFANDIGQKDLISLKPLLKSRMTARKLEKLDNPIKLMIELEKLTVISATKLEFLDQVADYLDNDDLTSMLKKFKDQSGYAGSNEEPQRKQTEELASHEIKSSFNTECENLDESIRSLTVNEPPIDQINNTGSQQESYINYGAGSQQESYVNYVAGKLGPEWHMLGYKLGLTSADMTEITDARSMLLKWQPGVEPERQIETLREALSSPKIGREDISICLKQADFSGFSSMQPTSVETVKQTTFEVSNPHQSIAQEPGLQIQKYKMTNLPRGICLIINNMVFTPESKLKERRGSNIDEENLNHVFSYLGFKVRALRNATAAQMKRVTDEISAMNHSKYDCFVCCILSHGDLGTVSGSDGESCKIIDFTNSFRPKYCPTLASKPKLFFLQACQGGRRAEVFSNIETDDVHTTNDNIPDDADFLLGYATAPGNVSFRSRTQGSWYITKLTQALKEYHHTNHILDILTHVNSEVSKAIAKETNGTYKQIPAPQYTLRGQVYFPKLEI